MKVNVTPRLRGDPDLQDLLKRMAAQVNTLSEGLLSARYNATPTAPTTGKWAQGDRRANSAPTELGAPGSKYVVKEFVCVASGEPGTWVEARSLTGN